MITIVVATKGNQPSLQRSFFLKDKMDFIHAVNALVSTSISCCQACSHVGSHIHYMRFKKVLKKVDDLKNSASFVPYKTNGNALKIHPGPPSLCHMEKCEAAGYCPNSHSQCLSCPHDGEHCQPNNLLGLR